MKTMNWHFSLPIAVILSSVCRAHPADSARLSGPVWSAIVDESNIMTTTLTTIHTTGEMDLSANLNPDTKIIINDADDIRPITTDAESVRSSIVFFSASLSMFAAIAVVLFFRKCVTCPSHSRQPVGRPNYYHGTTDGGDADTINSIPTPGPGTNGPSPAGNLHMLMTTYSTSSKMNEIDGGLSPSGSSLVAMSCVQCVDETGASSTALDFHEDALYSSPMGIRPPTRRTTLVDRIGSETPEALCLQDDEDNMEDEEEEDEEEEEDPV